MKKILSPFITSAIGVFLLLPSCKKSDGGGSNMCSAPAYSCQDAVVKFTVPNVFTPNGDGRNDRFRPAGMHLDTLTNYSLTVYTQSGSVAFQATSPLSSWAPAPDTVFNMVTYKYSANLHFTIPGGKTVDTCFALYKLPSINGCSRVPDTSVVKTFVFEDQIDIATGLPVYPTGDVLCPL